MFYTRPILPELNLDLVEIRGGGFRDCRFWGTASDGRPIYIHYEAGELEIFECSPAPDAEPQEVLLHAEIGPPWHGDITLEQVCDITGITVNGKRLTVSEEARRAAADRDPILDWSGRTAYWHQRLIATRRDMQNFIDALTRNRPDLRLLESVWPKPIKDHSLVERSSLADCEVFIWLACGGNDDSLRRLLSQEHVRMPELEDAFPYLVELWPDVFISPSRNRAPADEGFFEVESPARVDPACPDIHLPSRKLYAEIRGAFRLDNEESQEFINTVLAAASATFANEIERIDVASGEVIDTGECDAWFGHDVRDLCLAGPNRYVRSRYESVPVRRAIGWKPMKGGQGHIGSSWLPPAPWQAR